MELFIQQGISITRFTPSFLIQVDSSKPPNKIRWDKVSSITLISKARSIYFQYLSSGPYMSSPKGVVLNELSGKGHVVSTPPTLLPNERYLRLEDIIYKSTRRSPQ